MNKLILKPVPSESCTGCYFSESDVKIMCSYNPKETQDLHCLSHDNTAGRKHFIFIKSLKYKLSKL